MENTNTYPCKDCGASFELTEGEERFYTDRGLYIPKRCAECRRKKKEEKERAMMN